MSATTHSAREYVAFFKSMFGDDAVSEDSDAVRIRVPGSLSTQDVASAMIHLGAVSAMSGFAVTFNNRSTPMLITMRDDNRHTAEVTGVGGVASDNALDDYNPHWPFK